MTDFLFSLKILKHALKKVYKTSHNKMLTIFYFNYFNLFFNKTKPRNGLRES